MKENILSLDLGKASLGIAISRSGFLITPLENYRFHLMDFDECYSHLREVLKTEIVQTIVIGLPLFPSGDDCEMTKVVEDFAKRIETDYPEKELVFQDERYSTLEASSVLHENGKKAKKQKKSIDCVAACVILERYLRRIGQYGL